MDETSWRISERAAFVVTDQTRVVALSLDHPERLPRALVGTAPAIWLSLVGDETEPRPWVLETDLVAGLAAQHGSTPEVVAPDIVSFLTQLASEGLVEVASGAR